MILFFKKEGLIFDIFQTLIFELFCHVIFMTCFALNKDSAGVVAEPGKCVFNTFLKKSDFHGSILKVQCFVKAGQMFNRYAAE